MSEQEAPRRIVDQWFSVLEAKPEAEFDDLQALENLLQAEVERRLTLAKTEG